MTKTFKALALTAIVALPTAGFSAAHMVSFEEIDVNGDGMLSFAEVNAVYPTIELLEFETLETDGDDMLDDLEARPLMDDEELSRLIDEE